MCARHTANYVYQQVNQRYISYIVAAKHQIKLLIETDVTAEAVRRQQRAEQMRNCPYAAAERIPNKFGCPSNPI